MKKYKFYVIYNEKKGYYNRRNLNPEYDRTINGDTAFYKRKSDCSHDLKEGDVMQRIVFTLDGVRQI